MGSMVCTGDDELLLNGLVFPLASSSACFSDGLWSGCWASRDGDFLIATVTRCDCWTPLVSGAPNELLAFDEWMGWKVFADGLECKVRPSRGVAGKDSRPLSGLMPGYMMLINDGEGEGAREETALDIREAPPTSQYCKTSSSSVCVGPPSDVSASSKLIIYYTVQRLLVNQHGLSYCFLNLIHTYSSISTHSYHII